MKASLQWQALPWAETLRDIAIGTHSCRDRYHANGKQVKYIHRAGAGLHLGLPAHIATAARLRHPKTKL